MEKVKKFYILDNNCYIHKHYLYTIMYNDHIIYKYTYIYIYNCIYTRTYTMYTLLRCSFKLVKKRNHLLKSNFHYCDSHLTI